MTKSIVNGSLNVYGPRTTEQDTPVYVPSSLKRILMLPLVTTAGAAALNTMPDSADTVNIIPAGSLIVAAYIKVDAAFTSTANATGVEVGLVKASDMSTEIDKNGLILESSEGVKAALTAGAWGIGTGALIGKNVGAFDAALFASWVGGTDTLTGTGVAVVEYIVNPQKLLGAHA